MEYFGQLLNFSLIIPLTFVIICILALLSHRWGGVFHLLFQDYSSIHTCSAQSVPIKELNIPFHFSLSCSSTVDTLEVKYQKAPSSWSIFTLSHVNKDIVMAELLVPGLSSDNYFQLVRSCCNGNHTVAQYSGTESFIKHLKVEEQSPLSEGSVSRSSFPLVLLATDFQHTLVTLIHVKDRLLPTSYIIAQFYRDTDGMFYRLTSIYPSTSGEHEECIVCLTQSSSCVLLPCRHKCCCMQCTVRLTYCPVCRATINTYFNTQQLVDSPPDTNS